MSDKFFVLTGRSLLTDGIVSKLANSIHRGKFEVIDICQVDPLKLVLDAKPSVLVVDQGDPEFCEKLKDKIFEALPIIRIIFLNPEESKLRVVQSIERKILDMDDLLNELEINIANDFSISPQSSIHSEGHLEIASLIS